MGKTLLRASACVVLTLAATACADREKQAEQIADAYNYVIGTQTIGACYKFTNEPIIVETARRIREMGSNIIKIALNPTEKDAETAAFKGASPKVLASECPPLKQVLDMDFGYIFLWVTTPKVDWTDGMSAEETDKEYQSMREFVEYLRSNYNGTHKRFYIGHWEGDWLLLGNYSRTQETINPVRIQGMTDWYNIRQKAVDDARIAVKSDAEVYHYAELNRVTPALHDGYDRIANRILPNIDVDYVSYSSYESTSEEVSGADYPELKAYLSASLDYIEQQMKPKASIPGRRVFIGEYGYDLPLVGNSPEEQSRRSFHTIRAAMEWGCPFALYWEMYDNEGVDKGFWMIDNQNVEQPVYKAHKAFYTQMHEYVKQYALRTQRAPLEEEFRAEALRYLALNK